MKIITKPGTDKEYLFVTPSEALEVATKVRTLSNKFSGLSPAFPRAEDIRKLQSQPLPQLYVWYQWLLYQYSLLPQTPKTQCSETLISAHLKSFVVFEPLPAEDDNPQPSCDEPDLTNAVPSQL